MSSKKKIYAVIRGGLGNQLFIYSAARNLAIINGCELYLESRAGYRHDKFGRRFLLGNYPLSAKSTNLVSSMLIRIALRVSSVWPRMFDGRYLVKVYRQGSVGYDGTLFSAHECGILILEGYWQSEDCFKGIASLVRKELNVELPLNAYQSEISEQIDRSESVAVHFRCFDDGKGSGTSCLPIEYYERAIGYFTNLFPETVRPRFFVFSDDISRAKSSLNIESDDVVYVHSENTQQPTIDLLLMSRCKNHIIANSTFSWWGAWLAGDNPTQVVVCPSGRYVGWDIEYRVPGHWIRL